MKGGIEVSYQRFPEVWMREKFLGREDMRTMQPKWGNISTSLSPGFRPRHIVEGSADPSSFSICQTLLWVCLRAPAHPIDTEVAASVGQRHRSLWL